MRAPVARSARDRPLGLAPKGTSWGLALLSVYAVGAPGAAATAVSSLLPIESELSGVAILTSAALGVTLLFPTLIGMLSRRYWGVALYFSVLLFYALVVPISLVTCVASVVLSTRLHTRLYYYSWGGLIMILPQVALYPLLIRTLRLKYWQPWTRPEQWEIGDERTPAWAYLIGVRPPPEAEPLVPPEPAAKPHAARRQHRPPR